MRRIEKIKIEKVDDLFIKHYPVKSLLKNHKIITSRLKKIKAFVQYDFNYDWSKSFLTLRSEFIDGSHLDFKIYHLKLMAKYLDEIHSKGLFHGDIHQRNIIVKNDYPYLVDWEPCFVQKINSKRIIKSHSVGIAEKDRKIKKITSLTDKKGFLKLISEKIFNKLADTSDMEKLTCSEMLDHQIFSSSSS